MTSVPDISDEQLVQRFARGDLQAFDLLYNRYVKTVYRMVFFRVPKADVEDVTQEVFISLIEALPTFRGEAQFKAWLYSIIRNKVAEYYRKQSRKNVPEEVDIEHVEKIGDNDDASDLDDRITVRQALNNIHRTYREIILLRFAEGMRFKEIAEFQGQNFEATKTSFRRAMSAFQEELENEDEKNKKQK